ncbi:MAG TPA: hypothetical protein VIT68_02900 [Candidatus Gracilibacteria bacterium]
MNTKFVQNEDGATAVLMAIILPILLLMGALILESGNYYTHFGNLHFVSHSSAQSALIETGETLKTKAEENYRSTCSVLIPPSVCDSDNWQDFISANEIAQIVLSSSHQQTIKQHVQDTIGAQLNPLPEIEIEYPAGFNPGDTTLQIQVHLSDTPQGYFPNLLNPHKISIQGSSYLSLK